MQAVPDRIAVNPDLLSFRRGHKLILYGSRAPLYFSKGAALISRVIEEAREVQSERALRDRYPRDSVLIDTLISHGILTQGAIKPKARRPKKEPACCPKTREMTLYMLVSQSCNLNCVYCLAGNPQYMTHEKMSAATAKAAIDRAAEALPPRSKLGVCFFGGEPLLNWPLIQETVRICSGCGVLRDKEIELEFGITSNLSFLPKGIIPWASKHRVRFLVDIDGLKQDNDLTRCYANGRSSYDDICTSIRKLVAHGIKPSLRVTVTSYNVDRLKRILDHHLDLGAQYVGFAALSPYRSYGKLNPEDMWPDPAAYVESLIGAYRKAGVHWSVVWPVNSFFERLLSGQTMRWGCGLPSGCTPSVGADGVVHSCIWLVGRKRARVGSLSDEANPFHADAYAHLAKRLPVSRLEECRGCEWQRLCGGGCLVRHFHRRNGRPENRRAFEYSHNLVCNLTKKMTELALWHICTESVTRLKETGDGSIDTSFARGLCSDPPY
jgi:radical SAM protein with 4Fe4S-binding SPASM domain